jgi:ATP-dependent Clp endopeptidase proteolytic subunit ClpP
VIKWFDIFRADTGADCTRVGLYDDIGQGDKSSNDFINALNAVKTPKIDLHINSNGGGILDGFACYNAIKNHPAEVTTHIDGVAASIASLIALAGKKVVMAKNAFMMIHSGWAKVDGDASELRKQADVLDKLTNNIAAAYAEKSGKKIEDVRAAMDAETWFDCNEAKAYGLVDEIDGEGDEKRMASAALLAVAKYQKAPPALRKYAAQVVRADDSKRKERAMDKIVNRDGKWFCGDVEVDASAVLASAQPAPVATEALAQAREEGVKAERSYRTMFNSVAATAKLDAPAAAEFETQFYGRAEPDLKFLASHAIGQRAKPLGEEGIGNGEGESQTAAEKADKELEANATQRFAAEPKVRQAFGLPMSIGAADPTYQAVLKRYVARERQWAKDHAAHGTGVTNAK